MRYHIDRFGFMRRDGRIVGWSLYDLMWANGWLFAFEYARMSVLGCSVLFVLWMTLP